MVLARVRSTSRRFFLGWLSRALAVCRPPPADRRPPCAASHVRYARPPARLRACLPACPPPAAAVSGLRVVSAGSRGWRVVATGDWGGARGSGLGCGGGGCRARGRQRCERYGAGVGLGWLGRAPTAFSLRSAFGAPFSHRVFAFRCCLCFRHSYLTHPRPRGMRINALKATVLATLNCVTLVCEK